MQNVVGIIVAGVFSLASIGFGVSYLRDPSAPDKFWYPEDNPQYGPIGRRLMQAIGVVAILLGLFFLALVLSGLTS